MMNDARALRLLIYKHAKGQLTTEEQKQLDQFVAGSTENAALVERLSTDAGYQAALHDIAEEALVYKDDDDLHLPSIGQKSHDKPRSYRFYLRYAAAAAILLALIGTVYYYFAGSDLTPDKKAVATQQQVPDAPPGSRRAVLTLADRSTILLDSSAAGTIAQEGNVSIRKSENGTIQYVSSGKNVNAGLNTLETPNGGDYVLLLSDGSRCFVNANSRLRYPPAFTGKERKVFLSGEAYFEIAKNAANPFFVETENGTVIKVTGTKFNVNAYENEPTERTSLIEGGVVITSKTTEKALLPGEQATFFKKENSLTVTKANVNASVYWTKGYFYFNRASLKEVMRQLARWYDVKIEFAENLGDDRQIQGGFSRNIPFSEVLAFLKKYQPDLEYSMQNNRTYTLYRGTR